MKKLNFKLDFRSGNPIYIQIINQIKHKIATGDLVPDDQLPTVRQLAADLRVNFNTIARAYRMLDEEGVISTQHGRGTFILTPPSEDFIQHMRREDLIRLTRRYLNDMHDLGYTPEEVQKIIAEKIQTWTNAGSPPKNQE
jgi:GntR family transcriptional regulator